MTSETVEFAIDLGTTNSAIARCTQHGVEIIKSRSLMETVPSVVARTRSGQTLVGLDAVNKPNLAPAVKFKRLMGTTNKTSLMDGSVWSPEELSAEILKDLKASVQRRYNIELENVVITVPAMFLQPQCEATHRAAELAELKAVSLLQEPIAAATAYLNDSPVDGHYLVYDLGGGTFDVSLVRLLDNQMTVVAHGGDNYLGGSDFDVAIAQWIADQLERRHGKIPKLMESVSRYRLVTACERARINLSNESIDQEIVDLSDMELPEDEITLDRRQLERLISPHVAKTIALTSDRLKQAGLFSHDVNCLLLVGGPTMTPYIKRTLIDQLRIPVSIDHDPMTVVARGASIASSAMVSSRIKPTAKTISGGVTIQLFYEPVCADVICPVAGKVSTPDNMEGEVRLFRQDGAWNSGWIKLRAGAFQCDVMLKDKSTNVFQVELRDRTGSTLDTNITHFTVRNGLAAAVSVTPYDYGVALDDGSFDVIIKRNEPLPAADTRTTYKANKTLKQGSVDELRIYFLEGTSKVAADNVNVGTLTITGADLPETIRAGERMEIRLRMDESRNLKGRVYIPRLDRDYEVQFESKIAKIPMVDLQNSLAESNRISESLHDSVEGEDEVKLMQCRRDLEQIEAELENTSNATNPDVAERVANRLMPVKAQLRDLAARYAVDVMFARVLAIIDSAETVCSQFEDSLGLAMLQDMRQEAERLAGLDDERGLNSIYEKADGLYWQHYRKTDECWIGFIEYIRQNRRFAKDLIAYDEYLKRAEGCLQRNDREGVRVNGLQALAYLPDEQKAESPFTDAGITL